MQTTATESIQALVAPAVIISSSSLFFLGLNARHSSLLSRIRLLTDERRKLVRHLSHNQEVEPEEELRLMSVRSQLKFGSSGLGVISLSNKCLKCAISLSG